MIPEVKKRKTEYISVVGTSKEEEAIAETTTSSSSSSSIHGDNTKNEEEDSSAPNDTDTQNPAAVPVDFEPRPNRRRQSGVTQMGRNDMKWNEMFNRLVQYKAHHRNCLVPQNYQADVKLGRWIHYQRVEFWMSKQQGTGKITQARIDKLNNIGFEWDPQKTKWNSMFRRLVDFKAKNGHCMVPKGHKEDCELANWVRNQRLEYQNLERNKRSRMTNERKESLNSIGFQWNARS